MIQKCSNGANKCCNPCDDDIFCIDTNRIYDSSRAQDCLDSLRVILPPGCDKALQGASNIKIKDVKIIWVSNMMGSSMQTFSAKAITALGGEANGLYTCTLPQEQKGGGGHRQVGPDHQSSSRKPVIT